MSNTSKAFLLVYLLKEIRTRERVQRSFLKEEETRWIEPLSTPDLIFTFEEIVA